MVCPALALVCSCRDAAKASTVGPTPYSGEGGLHGDQRNGVKIDGPHPTIRKDAMARAPMKLHVKKNKLHKDLGKAPGTKITEADIAKEKSKGGVYAKRAQFAETAKNWKHPGKGKR
jgi:hypothetical protein